MTAYCFRENGDVGRLHVQEGKLDRESLADQLVKALNRGLTENYFTKVILI